MTARKELIQDLRAHAHEAPATCAALMRLAATELEQGGEFMAVGALCVTRKRPVKGAPCS